MKLLQLITLSIFLACNSPKPQVNQTPLRFPEENSISLFFCGDIMQHSPQINHAYNHETQDYEYLYSFKYIAPIWLQFDFVIANLETTLSNKNFSGYPKFCAPWQIARDLKEAGLTTLVTANNHCCDRGDDGIKQTIHYLDSLKITQTGTFLDTDSYQQKHPLYLEKNGFKIALLNYTYGTNGLPIPKNRIVSLIDTNIMAKEIAKAQRDSVTCIIAFMHWGEEYQTRPNNEQRKLSQWLHNHGVHAVIGSHPHVIQPIHYTYTGQDTTGFTAYSLGNLISNQQQQGTQKSICIQLTITRDTTCHHQVSYLNCYTSRQFENGKLIYYILPENQINSTRFPPNL